MNRYELFHQIMTQSNLASMRSILRNALDCLLRVFGAERAGYFAAGHGGLRCLMARSNSGSDIAQPDRVFPVEVFQKAAATMEPMSGEMPVMNGLAGATATGKIRIIRFLAAPAVVDRRAMGVLYMERRYQQSSFQKQEGLLLSALLGDIQKLLISSRDFEKKSFELDNIKSQVAMSRVRLISNHSSMLHLFRYIEKLAKVPSTVLIQGESGTGKELVARAIYELGDYKGPFISMNCGGIEPSLMKSELFGFLKGSFTGAGKDRPGLFKKAEGGVLFMDEIGEMPMDMQVAMLRTLERGEVLAVGADAPLQVNTRVIAATHRNLKEMALNGEFRNDLYQRLKGLTLLAPPLRDRRSDIPLLCQFFIKKYNQRLNLDFKGLTPQAMERLCGMEFRSGNVRELEHMIERAMVFEDNEDLISVDFLGQDDEPEGRPDVGTGTFDERMARYAVSILDETIKNCEGNKTKAMKRLGLSRSTFYGMLNRYGLT